jgi:hypothetical protein
MDDELLRQIDKAREKLLSQHGSFEAYVKHLRALAHSHAGRQPTKRTGNQSKSAVTAVEVNHQVRQPKTESVFTQITSKRNGKLIATPKYRPGTDPIVDAVRAVRDKSLRKARRV